MKVHILLTLSDSLERDQTLSLLELSHWKEKTYKYFSFLIFCVSLGDYIQNAIRQYTGCPKKQGFVFRAHFRE